MFKKLLKASFKILLKFFINIETNLSYMSKKKIQFLD